MYARDTVVFELLVATITVIYGFSKSIYTILKLEIKFISMH